MDEFYPNTRVKKQYYAGTNSALPAHFVYNLQTGQPYNPEYDNMNDEKINPNDSIWKEVTKEINVGKDKALKTLEESIREEERKRAAEIATEMARSHSQGGFNALGFNIARAILGESK